MREYIISTDSTADMPEAFLNEHNVQLHPLHYLLDGVEYGAELEQGEIEIDKFYKLVEDGAMPTTNATSLDYDQKLFEKAALEGKDVIHISFSSAMSTSYNNAVLAANQVMEDHPECKIFVIDSKRGSGGTGLLVREAVRRLEAGVAVEENAAWLAEAVKRSHVFFSVPSLMSLYRGGRLKKSAAVIGTLLKIQPTLFINDEGGLEVLNKVRGRRQAMEFLRDTLDSCKENGKLPDEIAIEHGACLEDAEKLGEMVKEKYGINTFYYNYLCPTLGSHTGQGILTFSFIEKE